MDGGQRPVRPAVGGSGRAEARRPAASKVVDGGQRSVRPASKLLHVACVQCRVSPKGPARRCGRGCGRRTKVRTTGLRFKGRDGEQRLARPVLKQVVDGGRRSVRPACKLLHVACVQCRVSPEGPARRCGRGCGRRTKVRTTGLRFKCRDGEQRLARPILKQAVDGGRRSVRPASSIS